MIFNKQGVPLSEVFWTLALTSSTGNRRPKRLRASRYDGAALRAIRSARGVGRPPKITLLRRLAARLV